MRLRFDIRPAPLDDNWHQWNQHILKLVHEGAEAELKVAGEFLTLELTNPAPGNETPGYFGLAEGHTALSEVFRGWAILGGGIPNLVPVVETSKPKDTTHYFLSVYVEPNSDTQYGLFRTAARLLEFSQRLSDEEVQYLHSLAARIENQ